MSPPGIGKVQAGPPLAGGGQAAGSQAQAAEALQLFQQLVAAVKTLIVPTGLYAVQDWTSGNLDIALEYPALRTGTFAIDVAGAVDVFLPQYGGPWNIVDGSGAAGGNNITVKPSGLQTIQGGATFVISTNWGSHLFILDGTNYL